MLDVLLHPATRFILAGLVTNAIIGFAAYRWGLQNGRRQMFLFIKNNKEFVDMVDKIFADFAEKITSDDK
ncbi:MAG: hypothetical protein IKZ07_07150 [Akkermansia sp.]|nr:hypothetical protein [Akkermansia sp.]